MGTARIACLCAFLIGIVLFVCTGNLLICGILAGVGGGLFLALPISMDIPRTLPAPDDSGRWMLDPD